jgi:diguanylate cyclase (GGDEF)-like protein/PAS domain S-box-containing protein
VTVFFAMGVLLSVSHEQLRRAYRRMAAQDLVRGTEGHLRLTATMFENSLEGITVTDAEGTILTVNPTFCAITGYSREELVGENPRLLKSGRHDKGFYEGIFATIRTDGFWRGEIWNRRKSGAIYPEWMTISVVRDAQGAVANYIGVFIDISRAKESEDQLFHLAHHDPLTDLPNRLLLLSRVHHAMSRALRDGSKGALLFLDLDHFKNVNDSLGHSAGDELLQEVARRYGRRLRDTDTLCRMGGDEFIVLLEGLQAAEHAADVARSLIEELKAPIKLSGGQDLFIGTSIGIAIFPDDGSDADKVLSCADAAMYQAKKGGRNTFRFYTEALTRAANTRVAMEAALRHGLERREFLLHYQPLVAMETLRVIGVEALVRWQHPDMGLVFPGQFIALAEETALILPLGDFVLRTACAQMKRWLEAGAGLETMAVNLSAHQFRQPDIADAVERILAETGLPAAYLELEITESALMDFGEVAEKKLQTLKALGVRLAIDDFGTGYSSLAYLKRFPIDKIKVDQSFVRDIPHDQADMEIVAAVVAMAKNLKLTVLAEGVETEAQLTFLRRLQCDAAQGYLFSRPLPPLDLPPLWRDGTVLGTT